MGTTIPTLLLGVLASIVTWSARSARADEQRSQVTPSYVVVQAEAGVPLAGTVTTKLRDGLAAKRIGVAGPDDPTPDGKVVARIRLAALRNPDAIQVEVRIEDEITAKTVLKVVKLGEVRERDRGLVLAIAIEELLRASWMELAMSERKQVLETAPTAVSSQVKNAVMDAAREYSGPPTPKHLIGAQMTASYLTGGANLVGGGLLYAYWPYPRVVVRASVEVDRWIPFSTPSGEVSGVALLPAMGVGIALLKRPSRVGLEVHGYGSVGWLKLQPVASSPNVAVLPSSHPVALVGAAMHTNVGVVGPVRLFLDGRVAGVVRGVRVLDHNERTAAFTGLQIGGLVGVAFAF